MAAANAARRHAPRRKGCSRQQRSSQCRELGEGKEIHSLCKSCDSKATREQLLGQGKAGAHMVQRGWGHFARTMLLQRQLEAAERAPPTDVQLEEKNIGAPWRRGNPGGGGDEVEAEFRSRWGRSGTVAAAEQNGPPSRGVLSHVPGTRRVRRTTV